jgi:hypothetical protein
LIVSIEDQQIIDKILAHLMKKGALPPPPELLPELSLYVRKAVEAGGFSRKSSRLNRLRPDRRMIQAYPGSSFLP